MTAPCPPIVSKKQLPEVTRAIARGVADKVFSAAASVGSVQGGIFHRHAQGTLITPPPIRSADNDTLFDLGELSMPLGAGLAAMYLLSRRRLDIQTPVGKVLKEFKDSPHGTIPLDMLLDHTSGLPESTALHENIMAADHGQHVNDQLSGKPSAAPRLRELVAALPTHTPQGVRTVVSSLNFLVLGWVLEAVCAKPLDVYLSQEVFGPLGLSDALMFLPPHAKPRDRARAAATLQCPTRQRLIQGEVADLDAWVQGGVAGHAGLFGTASGVWRLSQRLLACYHGDDPFFHAGTVARFWTKSSRLKTSRALAWDTPTQQNSPAGKRLSRTAVGHGGRTGCALWIDPSLQTVSTFLTNALHPDATGKEPALTKISARVFELMVAAADAGPPPPDADEAWESLAAHNKR